MLPGCKLALLLQIVGEGDEDNLVGTIFEQKSGVINAEEILWFYYKSLEELAIKAKIKNAVWVANKLEIVKKDAKNADEYMRKIALGKLANVVYQIAN